MSVDDIVAAVVGATGWRWDDTLDTLTMPRFEALMREWRRRPPAHWLLARALGHRAPDDSAKAGPSVEDLKAAFALGGGPSP